MNTASTVTKGKLNRNQKAMLFAQGIVERYRARGNRLPHRSKTCRLDPSRAQEYKDAAKLNDWKQSLKGNRGTCSDEIRDFLDRNIPNWRDTVRSTRSDSDGESGDSPRHILHVSTANEKKRDREKGESSVDSFEYSGSTSERLTPTSTREYVEPMLYLDDPAIWKKRKYEANNVILDEETKRQIIMDSKLLLHLCQRGEGVTNL